MDADQRSVIDGGFQELVRLGELPATDADVQNSLTVLDKQISKATPTGTGYYRYGVDASAGSTDGYGDCYVPDPTNCPKNGQPWPTTDTGSGHLWPVLSGERAETAIATGDTALARAQLSFMLGSASGVGLVPEQAWEDPDVPADPYGTDPTTASIGFQDGHAAGSASPLTWAQAQELRLVSDLGNGRIGDRPDITTARYVTHAAPANVPTHDHGAHLGSDRQHDDGGHGHDRAQRARRGVLRSDRHGRRHLVRLDHGLALRRLLGRTSPSGSGRT